MDSPSFYAVIPASVRYDENLIPNAKLLYGEISAMTGKEGFCWAENSYFANLYDVTTSTISRWISQLEKGGHIKSELNKSNGNSRKIFIDKKAFNLLTKSARPIDEKRKRVMTKSARPIDEKRISIYENITINNTINREGNSLAFFEVNYPSDFERLMMQYKSRIYDFIKFSEMFEATVLQEGLEFKRNVIEGRFIKYARNWITNQAKFETDIIKLNPNGLKEKIGGF
jgi:hypothetical protein